MHEAFRTISGVIRSFAYTPSIKLIRTALTSIREIEQSSSLAIRTQLRKLLLTSSSHACKNCDVFDGNWTISQITSCAYSSQSRPSRDEFPSRVKQYACAGGVHFHTNLFMCSITYLMRRFSILPCSGIKMTASRRNQKSFASHRSSGFPPTWCSCKGSNKLEITFSPAKMKTGETRNQMQTALSVQLLAYCFCFLFVLRNQHDVTKQYQIL